MNAGLWLLAVLGTVLVIYLLTTWPIIPTDEDAEYDRLDEELDR